MMLVVVLIGQSLRPLVLMQLLAICLYHPSDHTVASGVVCNRSQMRTSKCTCVIFGVSIGVLTLTRNTQKEFLIEVIVGKKMNIL